MSILLDALKKSQKGKPIGPESLATDPSPTRPADIHFSLTKASIVCAVLAMAVYILIVTFSGKTPAVAEKPVTVPQPQSVPTPLPHLEGIVWDPQTPMAVLDGKPLKIGDSAQGWTITAITVDQINVSREGSTKTLLLPQTQTRP